MKITRLVAFVALFAMIVCTVIGCAPAAKENIDPAAEDTEGTPTAETSGEPNEIVYVVGTEPTTMDVHLCTDAATSRILLQVHETLFKPDAETGEAKPWLAESATEAEDHLSWTIKLREGVRFHDGSEMTAEDVKYTFDRLLDPATGSAKASALDGVVSCEVLSPYELKVNLSGRNMIFPQTLTNYTTAIMSKAALEEYGLDGYSTHPSGTGPFVLKSWEPGIEMVFEKNQNYWGVEPTVDKLTVKAVAEDASRVMMIKTGDADIIWGVSPTLVENLKSDPNVAIHSRPGYRTIFIGMNQNFEPFKDERVRAAVNYAINKQEIIDTVLAGVGGSYPAGIEATPIQNALMDLDPYEQDLDKAKQLMAEAGYADGFDVVFYTPEGRYPMDRQVAEVVQNMVSKIGIRADLQVLEWGTYQEKLKNRDLQMFLLGKGSSNGDSEFNFLVHIKTGGGQNYWECSYPEVDEMLANLSNSASLEERTETLYEIQRIIQEKYTFAVLYYQNQIVATAADLDGLVIYGAETADLAWLTRK